MKTKHFFVAALDVGELLPFSVRQTKNVNENFTEQERSRKELVKFIDALQKNYKQPIWYMGMDVIGEKNYERFIFEKGGFFEVMMEPPLALNAHFVHSEHAESFKKTLQKTLRELMKKTPISEMFIDSISVQTESDEELKVASWTKIKEVRGADEEPEKKETTNKKRKK